MPIRVKRVFHLFVALPNTVPLRDLLLFCSAAHLFSVLAPLVGAAVAVSAHACACTAMPCNAGFLISVKGKREGELEITHYPTKLTCSFCVFLTEKRRGEALFVLYRLRVKESSILFSKTYGLLGHDKAGQAQPSIWDEIALYAQPAVMETGKLSTIRVEYVTIAEAEARGLIERGEVEKEFCRPFFARGGTKHYEVKCTFHDASPQTAAQNSKETRSIGEFAGSSRATSAATAVTLFTAVCVVVGVVAARRRGVTWESAARTVHSWTGV